MKTYIRKKLFLFLFPESRECVKCECIFYNRKRFLDHIQGHIQENRKVRMEAIKILRERSKEEGYAYDKLMQIVKSGKKRVNNNLKKAFKKHEEMWEQK